MKSSFNLILVISLGCLAGCADEPLKKAAVLSPSVLNTNHSYYNGKTVLVRGYVTLGQEDHTIYESSDLDAEAARRWESGDKNFNALSFEWARYCLTIANPKILYDHQDSFNKTTITIKGRFVEDYLTPEKVDLGACPLSTAIFIDYEDLRSRHPSFFQQKDGGNP